MPHPLIVTLAIREDAFIYFNDLRNKYFPAERNFINAHLTLFHALPNDETIITTIKDMAKTQKPFRLFVPEPVSIGKGVAYKIESKELLQMHKVLQNKWEPFLSNQDKQKLWPHITIQNKVEVQQAKELLYELKTTFAPFETSATGLQLWKYLGGPWQFLEAFNFANHDV